MKVCCIIYHSNLYTKYEKDWIIDFLKSIYIQTYNDFDIVECCYDNSNISLINLLKKKKIFKDKKHIFLNKYFKDNFECEKYLLNYIFNDLNYDVCINTNIDDIYSENRFQKQIDEIKKGYDFVSSNYTIFQNYNKNIYKRNIELITNEKIDTDYKKRLFFTKVVLDKKIIIPFSCSTFTKKCWNESNKNIQYPETLYLLKSILQKKIKVTFLCDYLLEHRIHNQQFTNIYKDKII